MQGVCKGALWVTGWEFITGSSIERSVEMKGALQLSEEIVVKNSSKNCSAPQSSTEKNQLLHECE